MSKARNIAIALAALGSLPFCCGVPFQDSFVMLTLDGYPARVEYRCLSGTTSISKRGVVPGPEFVVALERNREDGGATLRFAINPAYADAGLAIPTCTP